MLAFCIAKVLHDPSVVDLQIEQINIPKDTLSLGRVAVSTRLLFVEKRNPGFIDRISCWVSLHCRACV
jgi:hypothetical protein